MYFFSLGIVYQVREKIAPNVAQPLLSKLMHGPNRGKSIQK
jgi:hypothetical protein